MKVLLTILLILALLLGAIGCGGSESSTAYPQAHPQSIPSITPAAYPQTLPSPSPSPPSITVTIYQVGVFETGEDPLRGAPEQYIYIVASNGDTFQELRIPINDQEYLSIERNQTQSVYETISFPWVGSYLRLFIVGYEKDNSDFEEAVTQALGATASAALSSATGISLDTLFGDYLSDMIATLIGSEDDFLGCIERVWYQSQNWGAGKEYNLTDENLRVWLRISAQ